jgi:uncharacterized protein (UPF0335 family)
VRHSKPSTGRFRKTRRTPALALRAPRLTVRMRKLDKADFQELEAVLDLYLNALGMR